MGVGDENDFCVSWKVGKTLTKCNYRFARLSIKISPVVDRGLAGGVTGGV